MKGIFNAAFTHVVSHAQHRMNMKNIIVYYFVAIVPGAIILLLAHTDSINSNWFVYSFCFYCIIYRTYIDGKRLADKGLIQNKDIWKMIVPGQRIRFFKELYLR